MGRTSRLRATVLIAAGLGIVAAPPAGAQKVGNPGTTFAIKVQDGFMRIKTDIFSFTDEGRQPECSDGVNNADADQDANVDFPKDSQCTSDTDDSEVAGGFQPKQAITMTGGTIAANGTVTFPSSGVSYPPRYVYMDTSESSGGMIPDFILTMSTSPTANLTGSLDPITGAMSLRTQIRIDLDGGQLASTCRIEPIDINTHITGTTNPVDPNTPITGTPYNPSTGRANVVNNTFSVPGAVGCGSAFFGSVDFNDEINNAFGLPSASGNNEEQLLVAFTPTRPTPAIVASFTTTPPSGAAPLVVGFNASASTSVRPVVTYQWDFTNNGSFDASGVATQHTYATPGTYTARLRVTDDQGDFAETTRLITAQTPFVKPDALLKLPTEASYSGDGTYTADGVGQTRTFKVRRGKLLELDVAAQNDGNIAGSFTIGGCGPSRGYKVSYVDGTDVTQDVIAGTFSTGALNPSSIKAIRLSIKLTKRAEKTKSCLLTVTSESDTSDVDAVVARIKPR